MRTILFAACVPLLAACGAPDAGALAPQLTFPTGLQPSADADATVVLYLTGPQAVTVTAPWADRRTRVDDLLPGPYQIRARLEGADLSASGFQGIVETRVEAGEATSVMVPMEPVSTATAPQASRSLR